MRRGCTLLFWEFCDFCRKESFSAVMCEKAGWPKNCLQIRRLEGLIARDRRRSWKRGFLQKGRQMASQRVGRKGSYGAFWGGNLLGKFLEKCGIRVTTDLERRRSDVSALAALLCSIDPKSEN